MAALRHLSLNGNRISILSPTLSQGLRSLTSLEVKRNLFTHIPGNFLRAMTPEVLSLNFSNNNLAVLPLHWNNLKNLTMLNFYVC
jgi:Leucine-rich repeat (LRR) protein